MTAKLLASMPAQIDAIRKARMDEMFAQRAHAAAQEREAVIVQLVEKQSELGAQLEQCKAEIQAERERSRRYSTNRS
jgi:hypothetical protein